MRCGGVVGQSQKYEASSGFASFGNNVMPIMLPPIVSDGGPGLNVVPSNTTGKDAIELAPSTSKATVVDPPSRRRCTLDTGRSRTRSIGPENNRKSE